MLFSPAFHSVHTWAFDICIHTPQIQMKHQPGGKKTRLLCSTIGLVVSKKKNAKELALLLIFTQIQSNQSLKNETKNKRSLVLWPLPCPKHKEQRAPAGGRVPLAYLSRVVLASSESSQSSAAVCLSERHGATPAIKIPRGEVKRRSEMSLMIFKGWMPTSRTRRAGRLKESGGFGEATRR